MLEPIIQSEVVTKIEDGLIWIRTGPVENDSWNGASLNYYKGKGLSQQEIVEMLVEQENKRRIERKSEYLLIESFRGMKSLEEMMENPNYSHYRVRDFGITVYGRASYSPTGVISVGGFGLDELSNKHL